MEDPTVWSAECNLHSFSADVVQLYKQYGYVHNCFQIINLGQACSNNVQKKTLAPNSTIRLEDVEKILKTKCTKFYFQLIVNLKEIAGCPMLAMVHGLLCWID